MNGQLLRRQPKLKCCKPLGSSPSGAFFLPFSLMTNHITNALDDSRDSSEIANRCADLQAAFEKFIEGIEPYIAKAYEFQISDAVATSLHLSEPVLLDAVRSYYRDIDEYKRRHEFKNGARADNRKIGAFTTFWLARKRPIYDTRNSSYAPFVNDDFALFTGLVIAEVDPHVARVHGDGKTYQQLMAALADCDATAELLIPMFMLLHEKCTFE